MKSPVPCNGSMPMGSDDWQAMALPTGPMAATTAAAARMAADAADAATRARAAAKEREGKQRIIA